MSRFRWALPFLFALLFWASFHPLDLGFLGWFALTPLIVYAKAASGKKAFCVAWLAGAVAFAAGFHWVRYTVPVGPFLLGFYKGFYIALFVLIVRRLGVAWSPVAWTALEYARGTFFFGGFPWFLIGYTQHGALRVIQIADLGGVWLVTALVALVNAALVDGRRGMRWAAAGALAVSFIYGAIRIEMLPLREGPQVAVVQPNIPQDLKNQSVETPKQAVRNYDKHVELTGVALWGGADLIVWPEAAIYRDLIYQPKERFWYANKWLDNAEEPAWWWGVPMVVGALVYEPGIQEREEWATTNSALLVDPEKGIVGRFDKVHLVPFAEYRPLGTRKLIQEFSGLRLGETRAGEGFPIWKAKGEPYGPQICFEIAFPEISREIARKGARFTVNISNDGWFRDSSELDQMLAISRFRAIESRVHVIRATNTGISCFIEPTGRVQDSIPGKEVSGTLVARVRVTGASSLYRTLGDGVGAGALGVLAAAMAMCFFVDRKRGRA